MFIINRHFNIIIQLGTVGNDGWTLFTFLPYKEVQREFAEMLKTFSFCIVTCLWVSCFFRDFRKIFHPLRSYSDIEV